MTSGCRATWFAAPGASSSFGSDALDRLRDFFPVRFTAVRRCVVALCCVIAEGEETDGISGIELDDAAGGLFGWRPGRARRSLAV